MRGARFHAGFAQHDVPIAGQREPDVILQHGTEVEVLVAEGATAIGAVGVRLNLILTRGRRVTVVRLR